MSYGTTTLRYCRFCHAVKPADEFYTPYEKLCNTCREQGAHDADKTKRN